MFYPLNLLYLWLPTGLRTLVYAFIELFVLAFFISLILKIVDIVRG